MDKNALRIRIVGSTAFLTNLKLSAMSLSFTIPILLVFGDFTCGSHIEDGAAVPSAEDPLIPASVSTVAPDADYPWAAMDELFESLDDPQKSETWSISKGQKLKDEEEGKIFVGHYQKREAHHLKDEENDHLKRMDFALHIRSAWDCGWKRVSIWKQIGTGNGILTSYNHSDCPGQIMWVIGQDGEIWWKKETSGYPPHKPGDGFPILKYRFEMEYDYFCKSRVVHNAIKELHTNPEYETKLTYQQLVEQVDDLQHQKTALLTHNAYLTREYEDLKIRMAEQGSSILQLQATPPSRPLDHGDNSEVLKKENQMLKEQVSDLKSQKTKSMQQWRDEKTSLLQEHNKVVDGMFDHIELFKWICISGAGAALFTAFVMCCGFKCYHSNQKKQWEIQRLQALLSVNHKITEAHRNVAVKIDDYRPRSHSLDELHHKFGMNEIDKMTVKEGADLVRIARPLETDGAERKLSEELLGITPIISDGNGGTKQTNDTPSNTRTEGQE